MKKRIVVLVGIAAVLVTGTVYAGIRHAQHERNRPLVDRLVNRITRQLDLTDAQQGQVKTILEAERPKVASLFAEAGKNRQQLNESTASGKFDEAQVRAIAAQQGQTTTDLIVEKQRVKAKIYSEVLTPEQRTKADQFLQRMQSNFGARTREHFGATAP